MRYDSYIIILKPLSNSLFFYHTLNLPTVSCKNRRKDRGGMRDKKKERKKNKMIKVRIK